MHAAHVDFLPFVWHDSSLFPKYGVKMAESKQKYNEKARATVDDKPGMTDVTLWVELLPNFR
jgi:hypothetical protein